MRSFLSCALLVLSVVVPGAASLGCSGSSDDEASEPAAPAETTAELRATVGPEGGTLEGAPGSVFAGVRLVIPAGALAAPSEVVIRPTFDPTPLPNLAERVGAQFSIEGGALSSAASLTLPVDAATVRRFEQTDADVKVWVREGEGWKLVQASAQASGSVTIELAAFTTAAAGVKVLALPTLCARFPQLDTCKASPAAVKPALIPLSQPCNVPEAYCLSRVALASPAPESLDTFEVTADAIYYLFGESLNKVNVGKIDLATGAITQPLAAHSTTSSVRRNLLIDGGTAWVGLGQAGNARLRPKLVAEVFDTDRDAIGATQLPGGALLRLDMTLANGIPTLEYAARTSTTFGARKQLALANGDGGATRVKPEPGTSGALWAMQSLHLRRATMGADGTLSPGGGLSLPSEGNSFYVDFTASTTGRIAVIESTRFGYHDSAGAPFTDLGVGAVFGAAFLGASPLVASAASAPELFVLLGGSTLPPRVSLTDAPASDPAYAAAIPRGVRALPGGAGAVFVNQGREFFVLRISSSTIP